MKKRLVRIIAVILCLVMCLGLTGCSKSLSAMLTVRKTYKAIAELQSMSFDLKTTANGTSNGEPVKVTVKASCEWILDPFTMKIDATASLGKMGRINLPMYIAMEDNQLELYFGYSIGSDEPVWMSVDVESDGEAAQIDVASIIAMFENNTQPVSMSDEQELEESTVIPLTLELPGKMLMNAISGNGPHKSKMDNIAISVNVDKETHIPTTISADLAPLLKYLITESGFGFYPDLEIESVPTEITVTGVNDVKSLTLPDMTVNEATQTQSATETEEPAATETPAATEIPEATETPKASETPEPTETPEEKAG